MMGFSYFFEIIWSWCSTAIDFGKCSLYCLWYKICSTFISVSNLYLHTIYLSNILIKCFLLIIQQCFIIVFLHGCISHTNSKCNSRLNFLPDLIIVTKNIVFVFPYVTVKGKPTLGKYDIIVLLFMCILV